MISLLPQILQKRVHLNHTHEQLNESLKTTIPKCGKSKLQMQIIATKVN